MGTLPTGTVTFMFTDIEGSTRLVSELGDGYTAALERHGAIIRDALNEHRGVEVNTEGDAFFAVFPSAPEAVRAATAAQRGLAAERWPHGVTLQVRMGLHTGEGRLGGDDYIGLDVHRAARIAAAAHGGQVVVSATTRALVENDLPAGVALRDLGTHRLKDLDQPFHLAQLAISGLQQDFRPLRSLDAPIRLPLELSTFVGREREIAAAAALIASTRLLTLSGPGGSGKTRLAIRVAANVHPSFADGVYFVDLSTLTDAELVAPTVARVLGLPEQADRPVVDVLAAHLESRELLLVLDNFEHVLAAAPVVQRLLAAAPNLRVLATSRTVLDLPGEQEYAIAPLALPEPESWRDPAALERSEAVALFLERARATRPDFSITPDTAAAVAEICVRLDGLPLAIELAASRLRVLQPAEILSRLEARLAVLATGSSSAPARHRTLRATIDWSYELLPRAHRNLFMRLAVFARGCTLQAAEAVANPTDELGLDTLDGIGALVEHSLLRHIVSDNASRYQMLETIRDYARGRLDAEANPAEMERRHARFYCGVAEQAEAHLLGSEQTRWLDRIEIEHDNVRAALTSCLQAADSETGLRLAAAVWRFWQQRGYLREGRSWLEQLLASPTETTVATRARGYSALGGLTYWLADADATEVAYRNALAMFQEAGDREGEAEALYNFAFVSVMRADDDEARRRFEASLAVARDVGLPHLIARNQSSLGIVRARAGDPAGLALQEEALAFFRAAGDLFHVAWRLGEIGMVEVLLGHIESGRARLIEAFELQAEARNLPGLGAGIESMAVLESTLGHHREALRLIGAAGELRARTGASAPLMLTRAGDVEERARQVISADEVELALRQGRRMTLDEAVDYAKRLGDPARETQSLEPS